MRKKRTPTFQKLTKNKSLYIICHFDSTNHEIQLNIIRVSFGGWLTPLDCQAEVTDLLCEVIELIKILLGRIRAINAGATSALVAEQVTLFRERAWRSAATRWRPLIAMEGTTTCRCGRKKRTTSKLC